MASLNYAMPPVNYASTTCSMTSCTCERCAQPGATQQPPDVQHMALAHQRLSLGTLAHPGSQMLLLQTRQHYM